MSSAHVIERRRRAGRSFVTAAVRGFVSEEGTGEAVMCIHGVPASSSLYRKVLLSCPLAACAGSRSTCRPRPADRPAGRFDYTWSGLGRFCAEAVDELGLDHFHLVVHDIGGPVGFELAAARRDRIASRMILNTMIDVDTSSARGRGSRPHGGEPARSTSAR